MDLVELPGDLQLDVLPRHGEQMQHVLVQHPLRVVTVDDGADPELRLVWCAELANHDDVERRIEGTRYLVGDGYPTAGQPKDDGTLVLVGQQARRELAAGVGTILEQHGASSHVSIPRCSANQFDGEPRRRVERAGLLEEMGRGRHDRELFPAAEPRTGIAVHP